ncbi:MAG: DUF370 domain-containing protein [Clostridia bacterium]|nr:DUF370 domain-containing protein [Clostridia bacterium]
MYLHLGNDVIISKKDILFILDMDNSTYSNKTRAFLARAEKEGRVVNVSYELPKSVIAVREGGRDMVYISQLSSATLLKRATEYTSY